MSRIVLLLALLFPMALHAQFTYVLDQTVPVKDLQGNSLEMAWAGGLNAAQYNSIDLNGDGKDDLAIFDRMANKVITFVNENNQYHNAPEYEKFFPSEITNWLLLRDFNCDGKKDIFTGDNLGMKVYTNTTSFDGNLSWQPFLFYAGPGNSKSEALLTLGFSEKINLKIESDDLPSIVDADGDGDLDIFNMRYQGRTMEFHQNFSKERYGSCDSLDFERQTVAWGGFAECFCGVFAFNNEDCPPNPGRTKHAGGKSLLMMDTDGDTDLDVLFSESSCTNLYLLKNEGDNNSPIINSSAVFPSANQIDFEIFPAAFFEDVDFDGEKDLITSPNLFSRGNSSTDLSKNLKRSNWLYKNNGSTSNPSFALIQKDFLQNRMIDVGDNAIPAFIDYDGDGDYDMFISHYVSENTIATISLYKNSGTPTIPDFTLIDDDYLQFSGAFLINLKIQFADMNSDSKTDLVFTATSLNTGRTNLYYLANKSNSTLDFSNQTTEFIDFNLNVSENVLVADINLDGLTDLLVGKTNGALQYWKNNGPAGFQNYSLENGTYLGLGSSVLRQNLSSSISDLNGDGKSDLMLGNQYGQITIVPDFRQASDLSFAETEIIFNPITSTYQSQNLGGRIWPTAINLFNATKPVIIAGTILGGVRLLRNDGSVALPENPEIQIYPNPVSRKAGTLTIISDRAVLMQVYSSLGQRISESIQIDGNEIFPFNISQLYPGMYVLRFSVNNTFVAKRIIIY